MTRRKPPDRPWKDWVEEQIQEAQREGQFARLEGAGRPIPGIEAPYDPLWWVKRLVERERLSVLPPALALRAEVDRGLAEVWGLADEAAVRARVDALNATIARANRSIAEGPASTAASLDPEAIVAEWRRRRAP